MNVDHVWPENLADAQVVLNSYTSRYPSQTAIITNSDSKQIIADACLKLMGGSISADEFVKMARPCSPPAGDSGTAPGIFPGTP